MADKKDIPQTLTSKQIVAATGKTDQTIYNYRLFGLGPKKKKLPFVKTKVGARHRITFKRDVFLKWAAQQDIEVDLSKLK